MKLRASYSFLHAWEQGNIQEALMSYFHVPRPIPPNYVNGRVWDDYCQEYINKHSKLPPEWGGDKLKKPIVQMKTTMPYNALCNLVGVYDIYDSKILYELKSGHSASARQYAGTLQIPLYMLLADLARIPIKSAQVIRYNPKTDTQDRAILYPSKQIYDKAKNYLDSLVPEIHDFFDKNDLFNKTDKEMAAKLGGC